MRTVGCSSHQGASDTCHYITMPAIIVAYVEDKVGHLIAFCSMNGFYNAVAIHLAEFEGAKANVKDAVVQLPDANGTVLIAVDIVATKPLLPIGVAAPKTICQGKFYQFAVLEFVNCGLFRILVSLLEGIDDFSREKLHVFSISSLCAKEQEIS